MTTPTARPLTGLLRRLGLAVLLVLGMARAAPAWDALQEAVALLPQPQDNPGPTMPIFGYADLARLREDGELEQLLVVGWPELFAALEQEEAVPRLLGVPREGLRRILHDSSVQHPFMVVWGGAGFPAAAAERLTARGFAAEPWGADRLFSRWPDDSQEMHSREPFDPFGFGGRPQRLLAFGDAIAGGAEAAAMRALQERRLGGESSALARGMLAAIAAIRGGLPREIRVLQVAAFWPEAFREGESSRRHMDRNRPERPLPPGAEAYSPRLPPLGFALFIAAELRGSPVLIVAAAYESAEQAEFAAPVIAAGVQALGLGEGPPPTRVHDWALAGNGLHVAAATVLFGTAPRARASAALRHWLELVDLQEFTPLDPVH